MSLEAFHDTQKKKKKKKKQLVTHSDGKLSLLSFFKRHSKSALLALKRPFEDRRCSSRLNANLLTEDLYQAVKNLSGELYAKDVHFLVEIIQNAEDNAYSEGVKPSLEFIVTSRDVTGTGESSTLLVFNNEKGFSSNNIESICSVGRSAKKGQRQHGYIGEKGNNFACFSKFL